MIEGIIFDWIGTLYERNKGPFPFSEKVLRELKKKYKLGLISLAKHDRDNREKEIKDSGLDKYFNFIMIDNTKYPYHYKLCMNQMKTTPENTAIVDDRVIRGIKIGNELGCQTYWIQKGEYEKELPNKETGEPTFRINSVEDLLTLL